MLATFEPPADAGAESRRAAVGARAVYLRTVKSLLADVAPSDWLSRLLSVYAWRSFAARFVPAVRAGTAAMPRVCT